LKIHRDVLRGLLIFRGKKNYLQGLRVSDDGNWLVAAERVSLAFGSITGAKPGETWDGFGLEALLKYIPRGHEVLDLVDEEEGDGSLIYWEATDGPLRVNAAEHRLPSPESLVRSMEPPREGIAMAMSPVQLGKIGRALRPFDRTFVFPRGAASNNTPPGLWMAGKTGDHELRIFTMPLHIPEESWPR